MFLKKDLKKSFKETSTNVTIVIPIEEIPDIEIRLAAIWRDKTIVSQTFFQTIPGIPVKSKIPQLLTNMQISNNQFLICWQSDPPSIGGNYNIEVLNSTDEAVIDSFETNSQCHLFQPTVINDNEYPINLKVYISENREEIEGKLTVDEKKDKLEINVTLEKRNEIPTAENITFIFTNGTSILKMADLNDFLMLGDLDIIPFSLNENQRIT
uniref:Uncharacterized protein n=1 Tax=Panagrolaimus sp. PS1159 TaxID=55785 RepID=A0AC35GW63_9BILA